jgi:phage baseplate assembly protein W
MSADGFTEPVMSWLTDMSPIPRRVSGAARVGQRLARLLRTPRGKLIGYPNRGIDLSDEIENVVSQADAERLRGSVYAEVMKDVAVGAAQVTVTLAGSTGKLTVNVIASGAFGATRVTFVQLADGTLAVSIT